MIRGLRGVSRSDAVSSLVGYLFDNAGLDLDTWRVTERLLFEEGIFKKGGTMNVRELFKEQGKWEGRKEGMKAGIEKGIGVVARKMLQKNLGIRDISEYTGLSRKEIESIKAKLNGRAN